MTTMNATRKAPTGTLGGAPVGTRTSAGKTTAPLCQYSTPEPVSQAPTADAMAVLRGSLIYRGSRHVASLRGGELQRNLDIARETYQGAIMFHEDVLKIARANGAHLIVCTDRESGREYRVTMDHYALNAWRYTHPRYGTQWALDLSQWETAPAPGEPVQLSLLGRVR